MDKWQEIYQNNRKLDSIFNEKYNNDEEIYQKNCIELLVELGEFINETKCFKYWSVKKPDKDKVLEEYADCITMALYFMNGQEITNLPKPLDTNNILELVNYTFKKATELLHNKDEYLPKEILSNILYIKDLLEIDEAELINACKKKQDIILDRLNSDY